MRKSCAEVLCGGLVRVLCGGLVRVQHSHKNHKYGPLFGRSCAEALCHQGLFPETAGLVPPRLCIRLLPGKSLMRVLCASWVYSAKTYAGLARDFVRWNFYSVQHSSSAESDEFLFSYFLTFCGPYWLTLAVIRGSFSLITNLALNNIIF